ncbi:peptidase C39 family protein [Actinacidiphila acididurans]|uniref:Peptidase C39 family protein n=1 Tax=Actinacidiphila acididurans TaxID=2784346 RepID=A0ABS2U421_9ACTN|nr:peptidase C39 family protein [Actinacidiphila acididurans]MBM9510355.1 peptidase C39 family protein [Actinacidiphila acididurans]
MTNNAPRRAVLAAALAAAAATATATTASAPASAADRAAAPNAAPGAAGSAAAADDAPVDYHAWTSYPDWLFGEHRGTVPVPGQRPGLRIARATGTLDYTDPHTGITATWESASWTSPEHTLPQPATELVSSWNAHAPAGTWLQVELLGTYTDGTATPAYVMGRWTAGDGTQDIRRTSVDGQSDGVSSIWTDTFAIDDATAGRLLASYRLRLTLFRQPGSTLTPTVWRLGAMASHIPDRFTVPTSAPSLAAAVELPVPRYSQDIHKGQYPQYDNGGEAWCSPTSSTMVIEYWGRGPSAADMAWVDPSYADPQVDQGARYTYDYQYEGCGNWPFNAAYAATYPDLQGVITRLHSLNDVERLIKAGIPVITSQSFLASELDGAGYSTSGHLMCLIGFTAAGDVVANDPASPTDDAVHHVYSRAQFETIWLRTKRINASGKVSSGTGGVCYLYFPAKPSPAQRRALASVGVTA